MCGGDIDQASGKDGVWPFDGTRGLGKYRAARDMPDRGATSTASQKASCCTDLRRGAGRIGSSPLPKRHTTAAARMRFGNTRLERRTTGKWAARSDYGFDARHPRCKSELPPPGRGSYQADRPTRRHAAFGSCKDGRSRIVEAC